MPNTEGSCRKSRKYRCPGNVGRLRRSPIQQPAPLRDSRFDVKSLECATCEGLAQCATSRRQTFRAAEPWLMRQRGDA